MTIDLNIFTHAPVKTFAAWLEEAKTAEINDPNAMCLATVNAQGRPANRMVLLNGYDERGFDFYTNAQSRKGEDLVANPVAALCFHWKSLRRQVRVEGTVEPVSKSESDAYYNSRPRGSRIGAWASAQSRPLAQFSDLEDKVKEYEEKFDGLDEIPRPAHWHGFRVVPERIEFWVQGDFRLHHRYIFERAGDGWRTYMINP